MGVGRGGDEHRVDVLRGENLSGGGEHWRAGRGRRLLGGRGYDILDSGETGPRMRSDVGGVHDADAPTSKHCYSDHWRSSHFVVAIFVAFHSLCQYAMR